MDFEREFQNQLSSLGESVPELALHSCCAVCSSSVLERLSPHFRVTVVYYNPNITPRGEYERRKAEQIRIINTLEWPNAVSYVDFDYDHGEFLKAASGYESEPEGGARCARCFALRLERSARYASERSIPYICSTLTVSPHKSAAAVNAAGEAAALAHGVTWLCSDFKKKDGYLRSVRLAEQYNIYRQSYCGCEFASQKGG